MWYNAMTYSMYNMYFATFIIPFVLRGGKLSDIVPDVFKEASEHWRQEPCIRLLSFPAAWQCTLVTHSSSALVVIFL